MFEWEGEDKQGTDFAITVLHGDCFPTTVEDGMQDQEEVVSFLKVPVEMLGERGANCREKESQRHVFWEGYREAKDHSGMPS